MRTRYNVLFLCTGNSARSILGEAILNDKGRPNFTAYSAGSHPVGFVHPLALKQLELAYIPTAGLRSKSWDEFAKPDAPKMDFVFTVCDNTAKEVCPLWPGQPVTAHWGVPDPLAVKGTPEVVERAFSRLLKNSIGSSFRRAKQLGISVFLRFWRGGVLQRARNDCFSSLFQQAVREAFTVLQRRISLFLFLPPDKLQTLAAQKELEQIGKQ